MQCKADALLPLLLLPVHFIFHEHEIWQSVAIFPSVHEICNEHGKHSRTELTLSRDDLHFSCCFFDSLQYRVEALFLPSGLQSLIYGHLISNDDNCQHVGAGPSVFLWRSGSWIAAVSKSYVYPCQFRESSDFLE